MGNMLFQRYADILWLGPRVGIFVDLGSSWVSWDPDGPRDRVGGLAHTYPHPAEPIGLDDLPNRPCTSYLFAFVDHKVILVGHFAEKNIFFSINVEIFFKIVKYFGDYFCINIRLTKRVNTYLGEYYK